MPLLSKEQAKAIAPYRAKTRRTLDSLGCEVLVMVLRVVTVYVLQI